MKSETFLKACLLFATLAVLPGCGTLIGLGVGSLIDADGSSAGTYTGEELARLETPANLRVTLIDGTAVAGHFAGFCEGSEWTGVTLAASQPPRRDRIAVEVDGETRSIPLDAVESVEVRGRKGGRIAFVAVGLAIDAALIIHATHASYDLFGPDFWVDDLSSPVDP